MLCMFPIELVEQRRGGGSSVPRPTVCVRASSHTAGNRLRKYPPRQHGVQDIADSESQIDETDVYAYSLVNGRVEYKYGSRYTINGILIVKKKKREEEETVRQR